MAPRFSRPRLTTFDDRQYRAFVAQIMASRDNQRAIRPPSNRDLFGGEAEGVLREWLAESMTLSDQRIVEYLEHRGRSAIKKYRELDAVTFRTDRHIQIFEVKASRKATSLRRAARQLQETRAILRHLFTRVSLTMLLVDTGIPTAADVAMLMAEPDAPPFPPQTLADVLATLPQVQQVSTFDPLADDQHIGLVQVPLSTIIERAGAENLHLDWDEAEDVDDDDVPAEDESGPVSPFLYSTDAASAEEDADDGGAFGAAFRQAMQGSKDSKKRR